MSLPGGTRPHSESADHSTLGARDAVAKVRQPYSLQCGWLHRNCAWSLLLKGGCSCLAGMKPDLVWFDIPAVDLDRAIRFYSAVLGREINEENFGGVPTAMLPTADGGQ